MNAAAWQVCANPWDMLIFLEKRASRRKLQIFAAACCRRAWPLSDDPRHRGATEMAERAAHSGRDREEFERALQPVVELWADIPDRLEVGWGPYDYMTAATRHLGGGGNAKYAAMFAARGLALLQGAEGSPPWQAALEAEEAGQCSMLRDLFGSPFRPFQFDPDWLSGEGSPAVSLARELEREGRFDDVPILADVLTRAGCTDLEVLDHCRSRGPHIRGCWVMDALLDRECAVFSGLMTESDWRAYEDPASLLHFLDDKGSERQWRLFAVACCRRIGRFLADDRSRQAIQVAERYADGDATREALEGARAAAQEAQDEAKWIEYNTEAQENFCITPRYAAASRNLFAAMAARNTVNRDPRATDEALVTRRAEYWNPSNAWAAAAARWDVFARLATEDVSPPPESIGQFLETSIMTEHGKLSSGRPTPDVEEAAAIAEKDELRAQCAILLDLFGEFLGPPGNEGAWLPCGDNAPVSEWWCRLPTRRDIEIRPEWMEWSDGAVPILAREIHAEGNFDRLPELADILESAGCNEPAIIGHLRVGGLHFRGCWVLDLLTGRESHRSAPG